MNMYDLLAEAVRLGASDLHVTCGVPPMLRLHGELQPLGDQILSPRDTEALAQQLMTEERQKIFAEKGELDFAYSMQGIGRFRVNVFRQRGTTGLVLRLLPREVPTLEELHLPPVLRELAMKPRGLIIVTGPAGSGKSTTLAAMIDAINSERRCHIITLEDPIEYWHQHKQSIVTQRELGTDTKSYANALRAALRQDPDVILVGEMRDPETIATAITAAETGNLVLSTLHTNSAAQAIDRIIDVFPAHQQQQIRMQLAAILLGVVAQQLIPRADKPGRVAAIEILIGIPAIKNLIREGKTHQIISAMQTGGRYGMQTMDTVLSDLYKRGIISHAEFVARAGNGDTVRMMCR